MTDHDEYQAMLGSIVLTVLAVCFIICLILFTIWIGSLVL